METKLLEYIWFTFLRNTDFKYAIQYFHLKCPTMHWRDCWRLQEITRKTKEATFVVVDTYPTLHLNLLACYKHAWDICGVMKALPRCAVYLCLPFICSRRWMSIAVGILNINILNIFPFKVLSWPTAPTYI